NVTGVQTCALPISDYGRLSLVILPPSTVYTCPVIKLASSAARNATSAATSSGEPVRPTGWILSISLRKASALEFFSIISMFNSVSIQPGATALQRIPSRSEEHTSELQSRFDLVCRLLLEK